MFYASHRAEKVKPGTIKGDMYAIRYFSIANGYTIDLTKMQRLQATIRGIKRVKGDNLPDQRLPVTIQKLQKFSQHIDLNNYDQLVIFTAMVVATFGLLRTGEFAVKNKANYDPVKTLYPSNLKTIRDDNNNIKYYILRLKVSKTDIFRQGVDITLGHGIGDIDPIKLITRMIAMRIRLTKNRKVFSNLRILPNSFLFVLKNGKPLSRYDITSKLAYLCNKCGLDPKRHKGHSFRIGGATSLARRGFPSHIIQVLGRWRSDCYRIYTRYTHDDIAAVQQAMATREITNPNKLFIFDVEAKANPLNINV